MKKSKKVISILSASILALSAFSATACGGNKTDNNPQTLEVYIGNFGYGTEWLNEIIDDFKNETWVKEKYPDLNIPTPQVNSEKSYPIDQITSGKTTIDLFFSTLSATSSFSITGSDGKSYFEELSDLYEMEIEGEAGMTVSQKMDPTFRSNYKVMVGGSKGYYALPWAQGPWGIFYNEKTLKDKLGNDYVIPTTTNGLLQMCQDLKSGTNAKTPFVFCTAEDYQRNLFGLFWAQYEGYENYQRYWYGVDEDDFLNPEEFTPVKQTGRLRSLQTLEEFFSVNNGNVHKDVNVIGFTQAQAKLLDGEGVMQVNGDWIRTEMSGISTEEMLNNLNMLRTPVISSIVEKLSFYNSNKAYTELTDSEKATYDTKLQAIIAEIDNGATETALEGVSKADFEKVKEARSLVNLISGHDAFIPSYSTAKGLAKDFLMYMVSDKSLKTYIRVTNGCKMAYNYNIETEDPALYDSLPQMQKTKLKILNECKTMPFSSLYQLSYIGMLNGLNSYNNLTFCFTATNSADYHSAEDIYNADINYFERNAAYNWKQVLNRMGL